VLPLDFVTKILYAFTIYCMHLSDLVLTDLIVLIIVLIILGVGHKL
jgi:hypothetical protein